MPQNQEGRRLPNVTFKLRKDGQWFYPTTAELFGGKRVAVFGLPGAFTPTCSSSHLPRFDELAPVFKRHGIDEVVCVSVNDAFVMDAWARDQRTQHVMMLADGNGELTDGIGMLVDKTALGFGKRSWRFSMIVKDAVIEKMFVEPEIEGDPFLVSDADTLLDYVAPGARKPLFFTFFAREGCPHCARARAALDAKGMVYEEIVIGKHASVRAMRAVSGGQTTPQVFVDGKRIGTADDLEAYLARLG